MFTCENCKYKTIYKTNYKKHLQSKKHIKLIKSLDDLTVLESIYKCKECCKPYFSYSGLWCHNKKCGLVSSTKILQSCTSICLQEQICHFQRNSKIKLDYIQPDLSIITNIINGFYDNNHNKKTDISHIKEKTKVLNNRVNSIYKEMHTLLSCNTECSIIQR
jgi:hypothetical protein